VSLFRVIPAAAEPEPTTPPGSGGGGSNPDPAANPGAAPIGSPAGTTPGKGSGSGSSNGADGLANSGSPVDTSGAIGLAALGLLLAGLGLHLFRRGRRRQV
jgi:hypothetical protein